ncbi:MAG: hypothetical protein PHE33_08460 [Bacteroidales bacterium]|nr:hypothetical protein [Bacteroidales bacterium]
MQFVKYIFTVITATIILIGNNGFILEQYFCSGCNTEKQEIAFFEFGEIAHNHKHLHDCSEHKHDHEHDCSCHDDKHLDNANVRYISLDVLFSNSDTPEIAKKSVIELNNHISPFVVSDYITTNYYNFKRRFLKIPPLINISEIDKDICIINSVFRL